MSMRRSSVKIVVWLRPKKAAARPSGKVAHSRGHRRADLVVVEVGDLLEHLVESARLLTHVDHLHHIAPATRYGARSRLWPHRRCIAPDFMGLGYSEIPEGQDLSPAAQTRMVAALLDALGIDAVDLVANDSGNTVAQLFVAGYPERVGTLLLTNGDVHENSPPPTLQPGIAEAREGTFVDNVLVPQLEDPSLALLSPSGLGVLCYTDPAFVSPELLEVYTRPLVSPELRKAQFHAFFVALEPNPLLAIEPDLGRSRVPLRVIWGTGDHFFPASSAEWLDRTFPNSQGVRWVEGAKLFFPEEMPDLIAAEARRLWGEA